MNYMIFYGHESGFEHCSSDFIPRRGERALHRPRLAFLGYLLRLASLAWLWFVDLFLGLASMQWTVVFTDFTLSCVWPGLSRT